jgi:hypothetical protein
MEIYRDLVTSIVVRFSNSAARTNSLSLRLTSNLGSIAFKIDLSIILTRGDVKIKERLSVDPSFLE